MNIFFNEFLKFDVCYWCLSYILSAAVVALIPLMFKWYQTGRIKILDAQLKYIPRKAELDNLSFIHKLVLFPLGKPGVLLNVVSLSVCVKLLGLLIIICCFIESSLHEIIGHHITIVLKIFCIPCVITIIWLISLRIVKRDLKGLVGVLATELKDVLNSENKNTNDEDIHFATCFGEEGRSISYEKRLPFQNKDEIEKERNRVIVPYYEQLKKELDKEIPSKYSKYFYVTYEKEKMHICDFLMNVAYSADSLWDFVKYVDGKMSKEHLINFIGDKIGVSDYCINDGKLKLTTYHTDHFTFHVFKEIFHDDKFKDVFQLFIRRVNLVDKKTRRYMVRCLKFLFSSFGIDVTITSQNAQGKDMMLVGLRNGAIERLGNDKLHVPVNESFSNTDLTREGELSPKLCVRRGIAEELGLPDEIVEKASIMFYDFAIVSDEGEIGLSCNADFSSIMFIEEMRCYPGQDKFLENKNLLQVPYPPFFWDASKYPYYFYKVTQNDVFCTQWESFTPLLYQRVVAHKASLGRIRERTFRFLMLVIVISLLMYTYYGIECSNLQYKYIIAAIFSLLGDVSYEVWKASKRRYILMLVIVISLLMYTYYGIEYSNLQYKYTIIAIFSFVTIFSLLGCISYEAWKAKKHYYDYIMPLVPQWNSDVKVLQCNSRLRYNPGGDGKPENYIASKLIFGASCADSPDNPEIQLDWENLRLKEPPYCFVRREICGREECPISFYEVCNDIKRSNHNKLFFCIIPFYVRNGYVTFNLNVRFDNKKKFYEFSIPLKPHDIQPLIFNAKFDDNEKNSYSRYFGIDIEKLTSFKKANLDKDFQKRFVPMDLMQYQGNYYWSLYELDPWSYTKEVSPYYIDAKTKLFEQYIKDLDSDTSLWFHCKEDDAIKVLSSFISHPENRKRISTVDIYMLQLALIRKDKGCGKLLAIKK